MNQDPMYQALDKSIKSSYQKESDYMRDRVKRDEDMGAFQRNSEVAETGAMSAQIERQKRLIQEQARANKKKKRAGFLGALGGIVGAGIGLAIPGAGLAGAAIGYGAGQSIGGGMS